MSPFIIYSFNQIMKCSSLIIYKILSDEPHVAFKRSNQGYFNVVLGMKAGYSGEIWRDLKM